MKLIEIRKYDIAELANQNLFLKRTILPGFISSIIPLDGYTRVTKRSNYITCYECHMEHYIINGDAMIITEDGEKHNIGESDYVVIKERITCSGTFIEYYKAYSLLLILNLLINFIIKQEEFC
jgi:hypothetical protein